MSDEKPTAVKTERILIVDDDEFVCNSLKWLLMDEGYNVEVAIDGKSAVELLDDDRFDLVLTDLMMPDVDGLAVLRKVKSASPNTSVIILTGYGTLEAAMAALEEGAYDFLTKPCEDGEMKYKIRGALEQKRLKERLAHFDGLDEKLAEASAMLKEVLAHLDGKLKDVDKRSVDELGVLLEDVKNRCDSVAKALDPADGN